MSCTIIVGGFFGDEGKGKIVAHIAFKDKPVIISRGGVGPNAGHTVQVGTKEYGVRMVPSGFVYKDAKLCIGSGVLVDPRILKHEVETLGVKGRVFVDWRCGIITEDHIARDKGSDHLSKKIGSTGSGCGPANSDRVMRISPQAKDVPELAEYLMDVPKAIDEELKKDHTVLLEGTQGFGISLYYGTYPFVTSKDTSASQIAADNGVGPTRIDDVVVVFKAYPTRKRRIGGWDGGMARYSAMINGCTQAAITGIDRIDKACFGITDYTKLTKKARDFLKVAEDDIGCPITLISTGPEVTQIIDIREELV